MRLFAYYFCTIIIVASTDPAKPQFDIWTGVPADVRAEIEKLRSDIPKERADAAIRLGDLGSHAEEAVSALLQCFHDDSLYFVKPLVQHYPNPFGSVDLPKTFCPAKEAAVAISKIGGEKAVLSLQTWFDWGDARQKFWSAYAIALMDPKYLTPGSILKSKESH